MGAKSLARKGATIVTSNKYGGVMTIPDDVSNYYFDSLQQFIPHVIQDITHPAKVGDIVGLSSYLRSELGSSTAFVSRARTLKASVRSNGVRQVELLGLPCRWFSIGHFDEYKGLQIFDHIHGNNVNREKINGVWVDIIPPGETYRRIIRANG